MRVHGQKIIFGVHKPKPRTCDVCKKPIAEGKGYVVDNYPSKARIDVHLACLGGKR